MAWGEPTIPVPVELLRHIRASADGHSRSYEATGDDDDQLLWLLSEIVSDQEELAEQIERLLREAGHG